MPLILRKIQKSKWYKSGAVAWLPESEIQADALSDMSTKGNTLSIYVIENRQTDLERVATALAGNRDVITDFDYALFDQSILSDLAIRVENSAGDTADDSVNKWHRELVELTVSKILSLALVIKNNTRGRLLSKQVRKLIIEGLNAKHLDPHRLKLKPEILERLEK